MIIIIIIIIVIIIIIIISSSSSITHRCGSSSACKQSALMNRDTEGGKGESKTKAKQNRIHNTQQHRNHLNDEPLVATNT